MIVVIVVGLAASSIVTQYGLNGTSPVVGKIGLYAVTATVNVAMYMVAYRILTVAPTTCRSVRRGAVFAGVAYSALQVVGTAYVTHTLNGATKTYGAFAASSGSCPGYT